MKNKIIMLLIISLCSFNYTAEAKTYTSSQEAFEDSQRNGKITVCGVYRHSDRISDWGQLIIDDSSFFPDDIRLDGLSEAWKSYDGRYLCITGRVVDNTMDPGKGDYWMHSPSRDR